ncbi:hypothetical protein NFI96_022801, partial [Prochilodus magdalenae]
VFLSFHRSVSSLNVSSCSIDQKTVLYGIANSSFSTQRSDPTAYYQLISPYLGGAPVEDIRALSTQNISMDIPTFMSLDPAVLKVLSVGVVRDLMGMNLGSLKLFENATAVRSWIDQQYKSELATLNLGLVGGLDDPVGSTAAAGTNVTAPAYTTQAVGTTSQETNGSGGIPAHSMGDLRTCDGLDFRETLERSFSRRSVVILGQCQASAIHSLDVDTDPDPEYGAPGGGDQRPDCHRTFYPHPNVQRGGVLVVVYWMVSV